MKMKKRMVTMVLTCVCILVLIMGLTGCSNIGGGTSDAVPEKAAVCYVIANTANSQGLNMNSPLVQDTVYATIRNYGYISIVSVDGNPEMILANSYDIDAKYKDASKEKLDMDAHSKATNLITVMQRVMADDPEADYLEALRLAVRSISSLEGYDSKMIIVLGTGLGTAGILDFRNNLLAADPEAVVGILQEKEAVPDFSGITVYWQQMGDVAAPQQILTSVQRNRLQRIYGGVVEAGGGTFEYNDIMANPVNEKAGYPMVTPIELPADEPIYFDPKILGAEEAISVFEEPVVLSEEQVAFIGDKWEYLHPDEARLQYLQTLFGSRRKEITTIRLSRYAPPVTKSELEPIVTDADFVLLDVGQTILKIMSHYPQKVTIIHIPD